MIRIFAIVFAVIASLTAFAQQQSPLQQRIATQIGSLTIQNAAQGVEIEDLQAQLKTAQDRVKELEAKYEPKVGEAK